MSPITALPLLISTLPLLFLAHQTAALPQDKSLSIHQTANPAHVPDFTPPEFTSQYTSKYCRNDTKPIYVPGVAAFYPYTPAQLYTVVGSFFNERWIDPVTPLSTVGPDNTVGSLRKYAADTETLTNYFAGNTSAGFFMQMCVGASAPTQIRPAWTVLELKPTCRGKGSQMASFATFCIPLNASEPVELVVESEAQALQKLGGTLDAMFNGNKTTSFNETTCDAVGRAQGRRI